MNKIQKTIVSMLVIAMFAFSAGAALVHASGLPWTTNTLVTPGQLTVAGSSTVGPIATEEINPTAGGNFVAYWNNLVSTGVVTSSAISQVNLATLGSGTAVPALAGTAGTADVGEMSRPPSDGEFSTAGMGSMQQYCVGVDSVAIVVSPDMTWFPTSLTTAEVAALFADTTPTNTASQGLTGVTGSTALYQTWGAFFSAFGISTTGVPSAALSENILRAVRDPTSGTFDCFDNYFIAPNGYQFENKAVTSTSNGQSTVVGSQEMAPFTYCQENINIYNTVSAGKLTSSSDYIGFISLGYLNSYGGPQNWVTGTVAHPIPAGITSATTMIGIPISYNLAATPSSGKTPSPILAYYGSSGTYSFIGSTVNAPTWGTAVTPTDANVIYSYSGIAGAQATGMYNAWRWLWEVVPGQIQASGPTLVAGVWIAYMMADGTTNAGPVQAPSGPGSGTSNFAQDQNYISLERDDMAGGPVLDSNLIAPPTGYPTATQTQSYPTGVVNFNDITYFVAAYINYNVNHIYNPYADQNADGAINFNDISLFVGNYIAYYTSWNPI